MELLHKVIHRKSLKYCSASYVRQLKSYSVCSKVVYCDASHAGYAGYIVQSINGIAHGQWSSVESNLSFTWRELFHMEEFNAVYNLLLSMKEFLAFSSIKWFTDNTSVCSIVQKGSMKRDLQDIGFDIFTFCSIKCITLEVEWLSCDLNQ